jgi:hypothetical protein
MAICYLNLCALKYIGHRQFESTSDFKLPSSKWMIMIWNELNICGNNEALLSFGGGGSLARDGAHWDRCA